MKLVSAKCPNCGAQIEVDKNSDSTVCDYCGSKIIVDDAIEKYKVEISGSVQVNNLPTIENYIKIGDRYFDNGEYANAYHNYTKAVELDPDNIHSLFRQGLCMTKKSNYEKFEVESIINAMKNVYNILKNKNEKEQINHYAAQCKGEIQRFETMLIDRYKQSALYSNEVGIFNQKLIRCLDGYEYLYSIIEGNDNLKKILINDIIKCIDNYLVKKRYYTGARTASGTNVTNFFKLNSSIINEYNTKRQFYYDELIKMSTPEEIEKIKKESEMKIANEKLNRYKDWSYLVVTIAIYRALFMLYNARFLSFVVWVIIATLFIPKTKQNIIKMYSSKIKNISTIIMVIRIILIILAISLTFTSI